MMQRKEHLTYEGIRCIIKLKSALNLGLSDKLITELVWAHLVRKVLGAPKQHYTYRSRGISRI